MKKKLSIILLLIIAIVSGCNIIESTNEYTITHEGGNDPMPLSTEKIDLKQYDETTEKCGIDTIFEEIKNYPKNMEEFLFKDTYSNFQLASSGVDAAGIYAYYTMAINEDDESSDVEIRMYIEKIQTDAMAHLKEFIFTTTVMSLYPSTAKGIDVGDLAIGDMKRLTYIRGNVYVDIIGSKDVHIVDLAKGIDQQILETISKE
jgi:hypothetical protein